MTNNIKNNIILYQSPDGTAALEVRLDHETVWLAQDQMAELFGRERSVITKHLRNVFKEGELDENSVRAKYAHTAADGKKYMTQFYNLDAILSVGYRVNSQQGTRFRQWATRVLHDHIVKGYTINEQWLREESAKLLAMQQAVALLARTLTNQELVSDTISPLDLRSSRNATSGCCSKDCQGQASKLIQRDIFSDAFPEE